MSGLQFSNLTQHNLPCIISSGPILYQTRSKSRDGVSHASPFDWKLKVEIKMLDHQFQFLMNVCKGGVCMYFVRDVNVRRW